jgi:hypothetical protein
LQFYRPRSEYFISLLSTDFNPLFEEFQFNPQLIPRPGPQNNINYCGFIIVEVAVAVVVVGYL